MLRRRVYLRFLFSKMAVCSGVPEFAAYFRRAISEVRGKTEISRPDPCFMLPRPAVLLPKIGVCSEVSDFPALPEINGEGDSLEQTNTQTPLNRLIQNVVKPLRPIRNKEKAGAACAK